MIEQSTLEILSPDVIELRRSYHAARVGCYERMRDNAHTEREAETSERERRIHAHTLITTNARCMI